MTDELSSFDERELDLFDAFMAGFDTSAQEFNGEYLGPRYFAHDHDKNAYVRTERFAQEMLNFFKEWRNA